MKEIRINKEWDGSYVLSRSENIQNWYMIYRGTLEECEIIVEAFKKIGYKHIEDRK